MTYDGIGRSIGGMPPAAGLARPSRSDRLRIKVSGDDVPRSLEIEQRLIRFSHSCVRKAFHSGPRPGIGSFHLDGFSVHTGPTRQGPHN